MRQMFRCHRQCRVQMAYARLIGQTKDLFKQPPPNEECPICMLQLPLSKRGESYYSCCGKVVCCGCSYAAFKEDNRRLCPFCRGPQRISLGEQIERIKKRAESGDADGMHHLAGFYRDGDMGLPKDYDKAIELYLRAGELGNATAYYNIGVAYYNGQGVARDRKKAKYYYELGAMGGSVISRHNLGHIEKDEDVKRAMKHWMIAAGAGYDLSLAAIRECFVNGHATKADFERALRAHKESKDEEKSDQREAAATFFP